MASESAAYAQMSVSKPQFVMLTTVLCTLLASASGSCAAGSGRSAGRQILYTTDVYGGGSGKLMLLEGEPPANSSLAINPATGYNSDWEEGSMTLTEVATTLDAHMVGPAMDEANGTALQQILETEMAPENDFVRAVLQLLPSRKGKG